MTPRVQRTLIRFAGFAAGVPIGLALFRPWREGVGPHLVAVVLVFVAGFVGVAVVEFARRFLPEQRELDADEVDSLSDAQVRRLLAVRRVVRVAALALGFLLPLIAFPLNEIGDYPGTAVAVCLYFALLFWLLAAILLSLHPRQRILRAALRRRRAR
jgi:hypothetical protein